MEGAADLRIREQKDLIAQLNTTIQNQNNLITSLQKDKDNDRQLISELKEQISVLTEKVEYLTKKLFGTSSEKSKDIPGSLASSMKRKQNRTAIRNWRSRKNCLPRKRSRKPGKQNGHMQRLSRASRSKRK